MRVLRHGVARVVVAVLGSGLGARPRARARDGHGMAGAQARLALIAAAAPTHMSSSVAQTFSSDNLEVLRLPVTSPIDEVVAGLNAAQPA